MDYTASQRKWQYIFMHLIIFASYHSRRVSIRDLQDRGGFVPPRTSLRSFPLQERISCVQKGIASSRSCVGGLIHHADQNKKTTTKVCKISGKIEMSHHVFRGGF